MKIQPNQHQSQRGSTLVTILILGSIALVAAGSLLAWTSTSSQLSGRNNEYFSAAAAAEAATEKVFANIADDYRDGGEGLNQSRLNEYRQMVPTAADDPRLADFKFTDGQSQAAKTHVEWLPPSGFKVLGSQFRGLQGYTTSFRIISNARDTKTRWGITAGVQQEMDVTTIPLFQFAIFYNLDLEIHPGAAMTVTGPVHGNYDIYMQPGAPLTFKGNVSAAGNIINGPRTGDCEGRSGGATLDFQAGRDDSANQLNMPVGTNSGPAAVRAILDPPPAGESALSGMGKERFYNKADLIVTVSGHIALNPTVKIKSGLEDNFKTEVTAPPAVFKISSFHNKREGKTVRALDIDVAQLSNWNKTNKTFKTKIGQASIIYVDDKRNSTALDQVGVRLKNGEELPEGGLTVATRDPIYVLGNYNTKISSSGSGSGGTSLGNDTTYTKPAALIGDAITILSKSWNDLNSTLSLGSRKAQSTTVNAAIMAGINASTNCNYSGGVENFPRFLEDWSGVTFTYNGSMVVMYESLIAKSLWLGTGSTIGIYNPPVRQWAFDKNFENPAKLPPGTPSARASYRTRYAVTLPNSTTPYNP